jgi:hypothetical protein
MIVFLYRPSGTPSLSTVDQLVDQRSNTYAPIAQWGHDYLKDFKILHDRTWMMNGVDLSRAIEWSGKISDHQQ